MTGKQAIVFIDGNNFYHNVKKTGLPPSKINFSKLCELICSHYKLSFKGAFYYNSVPSLADGEKKYYDHIKFLNKVSNMPKITVKTRKLQKRSAKEILGEFLEQKQKIEELGLCEKCNPKVPPFCFNCLSQKQRREKGIDVLIAIDIVEKALENKYDCCILISGDSDFVPAIELIKKRGKRAISAFVEFGYSNVLRDTTEFRFLKKEDLLNCLLED